MPKSVTAEQGALKGVTATTVVHLCFGYAAVVSGQKPTGYAFLTQLADSTADQISIEYAQPALNLGMLQTVTHWQRWRGQAAKRLLAKLVSPFLREGRMGHLSAITRIGIWVLRNVSRTGFWPSSE